MNDANGSNPNPDDVSSNDYFDRGDAMSDREKAEKWPIKNEFFVEIEDHSEDGSWSGYAHSEEFPRGSDSRKAVLLEPNTIQVPRELWEEVKKALRSVTHTEHDAGYCTICDAMKSLKKAGLR